MALKCALVSHVGVTLTTDGNLFAFDAGTGMQLFICNIFEYVADSMAGGQQDNPSNNGYNGYNVSFTSTQPHNNTNTNDNTTNQAYKQTAEDMIMGLEVFRDAMVSPIVVIWTLYTVYALRISFETPQPSYIPSSSSMSMSGNGNVNDNSNGNGNSSVYSKDMDVDLDVGYQYTSGKPEVGVGFKSTHSFINGHNGYNNHSHAHTHAQAQAPHEIKVVRFVKYSFIKEGSEERSENVPVCDFQYHLSSHTNGNTNTGRNTNIKCMNSTNKSRIMYVTPMRNPQFDDIYTNTLHTDQQSGLGLGVGVGKVIPASRSHKILVVLSDGTVHILQY